MGRRCSTRSTVTAPAVSASAASSASDSALSTDTSSARSSSLATPDQARTRPSASSISRIHASWGMRVTSTPGCSSTSGALPAPISPRKPTPISRAAPPLTLTAAMASKFMLLSACRSTPERRASPSGWVCMQRIMDRRPGLRRSRRLLSGTLSGPPTVMSSTRPSRLMYTLTSRLHWPEKAAMRSISSGGAKQSPSISISYSSRSRSSADCRMPSVLPFILLSFMEPPVIRSCFSPAGRIRARPSIPRSARPSIIYHRQSFVK